MKGHSGYECCRAFKKKKGITPPISDREEKDGGFVTAWKKKGTGDAKKVDLIY